MNAKVQAVVIASAVLIAPGVAAEITHAASAPVAAQHQTVSVSASSLAPQAALQGGAAQVAQPAQIGDIDLYANIFGANSKIPNT